MKIDKQEHPIPKSKRNKKYPLDSIQPGESFFIAGQSGTQNACSAIWNWCKRHGGKFTARAIEGGVRVWRIE